MATPENDQDERPQVITSVYTILEDIRRRGTRGTTSEEASYRINVHINSYTGRRSELHRRGIIERLAERRGGQHVYVMPDHVEGRETYPFTPHRGPAGPEVEEATIAVEHWLLMGDSHIPDGVQEHLLTLINYAKEDL